jgi:putative transcriptional regulator
VAIIVDLDLMLVKRKMKLSTLSEQVGISIQNLSILKTGKAKAIRFSTLESLCHVLKCQPGDILRNDDNITSTDEQNSGALSDC